MNANPLVSLRYEESVVRLRRASPREAPTEQDSPGRTASWTENFHEPYESEVQQMRFKSKSAASTPPELENCVEERFGVLPNFF